MGAGKMKLIVADVPDGDYLISSVVPLIHDRTVWGIDCFTTTKSSAVFAEFHDVPNDLAQQLMKLAVTIRTSKVWLRKRGYELSFFREKQNAAS